MPKQFSLILFVALLQSVSALANMSASTNAKYYVGENLVMGPRKLTGATQARTFTQFFSATQAPWTSQILSSYLDGPAKDGFQALLTPPAQPVLRAADLHYISIDPNAMYDRVEFEFDVWSTKKPLKHIRMLSPGKDAFRFDAPVYEEDQRRGSAKIRLYTRHLEPGTYPLLFVARQTGCVTCLSVEHWVLVRISTPCRRHPVNLACRPQYLERSRIELKTSAIQEFFHGLALSDPAMAKNLDAVENCKLNENCPPAVLGECPERAIGASGRTCAKLKDMELEQQQLFSSRAEIDTFFANTDCCRK